MKFTHATIFAAAATLAACQPAATEAPPLAEGDWALESDASRLTYVSVKSGEIAEVNEFKAFEGSVTPDGEATLEIDLATVQTGVDIRDERMRDIFFQVADHPKATFTTTFEPKAFADLAVGGNTVSMVKGTLTVKGVEAPVEAEVNVTRTGPDTVTVATVKPVIVMADALKLTEGLAQLQELAGLPSITPAVPVTFSLKFERK